MYNGLLNILKPTGITSSDAVVKVKKIFNQKKVGHMGTLDPMGAGVLVLGLGKSARLFDYFLTKDKEYYAVFQFGTETDTLDSSGIVTSVTKNIPSKKAIEDMLYNIKGTIDQLPPKFSAKNINGVRAYDLARRGEDFELKTRKVEISDITLVHRIDEKTFGFNIVCSSGTYIRSIARDLAYALNSLATMTSIIRTRCGMFKINDSLTLEEIAETGEKAIISPEIAVELEDIYVSPEEYNKLMNGINLIIQNSDGNYRLFCGKMFLGIADVRNNLLKVNTWIKENEDS